MFFNTKKRILHIERISRTAEQARLCNQAKINAQQNEIDFFRGSLEKQLGTIRDLLNNQHNINKIVVKKLKEHKAEEEFITRRLTSLEKDNGLND